MSAIPRAVLKWYDANARDLPWRVGPAARKAGETPDPYKVWLSEIMLQQTTVATVAPRFEAFLARWPTVRTLAAAPPDAILSEWAGLGYYARARNLHRCAALVAERGDFPNTEEGLRALPGIGAYTAAAIAAIAFDRRAVVIDSNIERVTARLFAVETPLRKSKAEIRAAIGALWPKKRSGDFAQGLMDLGAMVCGPRNPNCGGCPLFAHCKARANGLAESLPRKAEKAERPTRCGAAYALVNRKGEMLFERRPEKGLLGGCLGLPCTEWVVSEPPLSAARTSPPQSRGRKTAAFPPPFTGEASAKPTEGGLANNAIWRRAGTVAHTFTHFRLELDVMTATAPKTFRATNGQRWLRPEEARLPSVMKKAVERALAGMTGS
jgi:A/G-specific adenine glycosylase